MVNLEILLKENKYNQAKEEAFRLLQVSTGEPILELLIQISIFDKINLPIMNSIYRSVKFCNGKGIQTAILFAIEQLKSNNQSKIKRSNFHKLEIVSNILEITQTRFIRNDKIQSEISFLDNSELMNEFIGIENSKLNDILINQGRKYILQLIIDNDNLLNSSKNILIMDSIRTILRYRDSTNYDIPLNYASSLIENFIE